MLLVTRLPGATEAGVPGCGSKRAMVLFRRTPVPGTVAFDPNRLLMVWVIATTLPSASAVVTWVVWAEPAATPATAPYSPARSSRIWARRAAACSFEMSRSTGMSTKAGSPVQALRSAKPILSTSAIRWK